MNKTVIFLTEKHFYFCPFTKIQIYNQIKDVRKEKKTMMMLFCKEKAFEKLLLKIQSILS